MLIRFLSYNIHKGYDWYNSKNVLGEIRDAIREVDADVCFLQEVLGGGELSPVIARARALLGRKPEPPAPESAIEKLTTAKIESQFEFLADTIWSHHSYGKNALFPNRHHGNATLTKFPIVRNHNLNISTNRFEQRGLLHCEIELPVRNLHLLNTHLNLLETSRRHQAHMILQYIRENVPHDAPLIFAGDFNDWNGAISDLIRAQLGAREVHFPHVAKPATFPSFFPVLHLDRIFYRGLTLNDMDVLDSEPWSDLSDHIPLFACFETGN